MPANRNSAGKSNMRRQQSIHWLPFGISFNLFHFECDGWQQRQLQTWHAPPPTSHLLTHIIHVCTPTHTLAYNNRVINLEALPLAFLLFSAVFPLVSSSLLFALFLAIVGGIFIARCLMPKQLLAQINCKQNSIAIAIGSALCRVVMPSEHAGLLHLIARSLGKTETGWQHT